MVVWAQLIASLGWNRFSPSGSQKCPCWFCKLRFGFRGLKSVVESLAASTTFGGLERVQPEVPVTQWAALNISWDHGNTTWRGTAPRGFPHLTAPAHCYKGEGQLQPCLQLGFRGKSQQCLSLRHQHRILMLFNIHSNPGWNRTGRQVRMVPC